ncbi:MAG: UDP-N-acetylmuramoyl-L-alanine--D-glutamate ligase [Parvibaculales bacterium]
MIPLPKFDGETAIFGLARSGLACVEALCAAGNKVVAWDDAEAPRQKAAQLGADIRDLANDFGTPKRLILSPGVPLTHPQPHAVVQAATQAGCPIGGDMDLLATACATQKTRPIIIGITGTNGKSTTAALIHHILRSAGRDCQLGGNIGNAVMHLHWPKDENAVFVLELSSYQLALNSNFIADIAVLTNISPDHLDRHGDMVGYSAAKENLFERTPTPLAIIACEDEASCAIAMRHEMRGGRIVRIGGDMPVAPISAPVDTVLRGAHNAQNAALARAVAHALGLADKKIDAALQSFSGLQHRLQAVAQHGHLTFVNDSKATNAEATRQALLAYPNIYWIVGGRAKEDGLAGLETSYSAVRAAYLIGEAAENFAATLGPYMPCTISHTLDQAVIDASNQADADNYDEATILLSPACASFDQFTDFEARGAAFCAAIADWQKTQNANPKEVKR